MPGNCAIFRSWETGNLLTASDLTMSFTQVGVTNMTPSCLDDYAVDTNQFRSTVDPYPGSVASFPTSLAGELERIRFVLKTITGWSQWYAHTETASGGVWVATTGDTMTGSLLFSPDNSVDIGAAGATRARSIYLGTAAIIGTNPAAAGAVRVPNNTALGFRNAANSADFTLKLNASNLFEIDTGLKATGSDSIVATLIGHGGGSSNGCQLRFAGQQDGELFAIGTDVSTDNGTRSFEIFDLVAVASRLVIGPTGAVTIADGSTAGVLNAGVLQASGQVWLNIDNNNDTTNAYFLVGKDRATTSGGTDLFVVHESGVVQALSYLTVGAAFSGTAPSTPLAVTGAAAITGALSLGTNPASAGSLRLANAGNIGFRNAANNADINGLNLNSSDQIVLGGTSKDVIPDADNNQPFGTSAKRWQHGIFGTSIQVGTNPAAAGAVRLANAVNVSGRNAGNSADVIMAQIDSSDRVRLGPQGSGNIRMDGQVRTDIDSTSRLVLPVGTDKWAT